VVSQPEVTAGRKTRAARRGVERRALRLDEVVEAGGIEDLIQPDVERMPGAARQVLGPPRLVA
jgi:hypothetical protein